MRAPQIVDLSYALDATIPVYPGDPRPEILVLEHTSDVIPGRRALNNSRISFGMHCGTHMDAPFHFFSDRRTIDQVPLDRLVGPALRIDLRAAVMGGTIGREHLEPREELLRRHQRVILETGWEVHWGKPEYFSDHPLITGESAQFLVDCGAQLVGIDMPSVDRPPFPAHLTLLSNDVVIVENLKNLRGISDDVFELIVLPLKIVGRDGSPVRALARTA
jgi:kynurenine formamidase